VTGHAVLERQAETRQRIEIRIRERLMAIAEKIAASLADAVGLEGPPLGK
jgi:hypothetical protein